jgi:hypothetical protein
VAVIAIALGACSAAAQESLAAVEPASAAPVIERAAATGSVATCDVRAHRAADGVLIQGRAFADSDVDGEYELVITKTGASESEISQAGPVSIAAGRSITFGESEISLERGSRLHAVLTLRDADGVVCRDALSL